jgi:Protein of unknown function (DUF2934)
MTTHPVIDHLAKDERIRAIAYAIWEEEGRPEGCAEAHWLRACEIVEAEAVEPDWLKRKEEPASKTEIRHEPRRKVA